MKRRGGARGKSGPKQTKKARVTKADAVEEKKEAPKVSLVTQGWSGLNLAHETLKLQLRGNVNHMFLVTGSGAEKDTAWDWNNVEFTGPVWLPNEIIVKILAAVPDGKSFLACRCVSKFFHLCTLLGPHFNFQVLSTRQLHG